MVMSDRIAVIYRGEFVDILDAQTTTVEEIGLLKTGESGELGKSGRQRK